MTTRRQQRVRIRARGDMTTQEAEPAKAKPSNSNVGNPSYAKAKQPLPRSKPPEPPKQKPPATSGLPPAEREEVPRPVPEVEQAKDLVKVDDILKNPVLTPDEVGTLLRVSPETVLKLAQDGDLPAMRVHKETRMLRRDVIAFVRELRARNETLRRYHESAIEEREHADT